jgi:hypothetical protein
MFGTGKLYPSAVSLHDSARMGCVRVVPEGCQHAVPIQSEHHVFEDDLLRMHDVLRSEIF